MGFVVSSHFKGKKTETQTSELGQGQQPIKIEELRFKLNLLTLCLGRGGLYYAISGYNSGDCGS